MRLLPRTTPLQTALLVVALCAAVGCDIHPEQKRAPALATLNEAAYGKKDKDFKPGKVLAKSDDEVRNEALEQVKENLKKQEKFAADALKNGGNVAKKKDKKKSDSDDPRMPQLFTTGNTPIVEIGPDTKDNKHSERSIPFKDPSNSGNHFAEIMGPGQKSPTRTGDTVNMSHNENSGKKKSSDGANDVKVMNGNNGTAELGDPITLGAKVDKPGLFSRLFGIKKPPETRMVRTGDAGKQFEITNERMNKKDLGKVYSEKPDGTSHGTHDSPTAKQLSDTYNPNGTKTVPNLKSFTPTPAETKSLESQRIASEMLRIQMKNEATMREKKELEAGGNKKAVAHSVTDFEPPPAPRANVAAAPGNAVSRTEAPAKAPAATGAPSGNAASPNAYNPGDNAPITADNPINAEFNAAKIAAAEQSAKDAAPAKSAPNADEAVAVDEAQRQLGSLDDYRKGLATRDIVAREAAFMRAAAERREDAIPALVDEVVHNGMLAVTAARTLGLIGRNADFIERGLMTGLNTNGPKDAALREACAETLGQMRIRKAVPLLIEKAKLDKNYTVRSACVAALGKIGDPASVATLHMKLDERNEIEFVKQSAALALARMGDPAGRDHLIQSLDSPSPAFQVLGLTGLAQLNDSGSPGYLIACLDSRNDEVWTTAVQLFPRIGAHLAVPMLRAQLACGNETMRVRASLALGLLGCSDGMALICRAARSGTTQERILGCELLGRLERKDQIPLLMDKLGDPSSNVRQTAAASLTLLDAREAVPMLMDAARGRFKNQLIQASNVGEHPEQRARDSRSILSVQVGSPTDMNERMVMLACVRSLRGEKDDVVLRTLPSSRDSSWPEFDRELLKQQIDLIKMYKLADVIPSGAGGAGALIQVPGGQEILYRRGEIIAGGFKVREISLGAPAPQGKTGVPPFVTLQRGDERITLYQGQAPEVDNTRDNGK